MALLAFDLQRPYSQPLRSCGRVAEGGALLKRYTFNGVSRVRIPPAPPDSLFVLIPDRNEPSRFCDPGVSAPVYFSL